MGYVSKLLVTCGDRYVLSIKKSLGNPRKNKRLELFGGKVDPGETPFQGLIRELSEEESSGTLAGKAAGLAPEPIQTFELGGKKQCIYALEIDEHEMAQLIPHPQESFGISTVKKSHFDSPENIDMEMFTPKTIGIFDKLGLI